MKILYVGFSPQEFPHRSFPISFGVLVKGRENNDGEEISVYIHHKNIHEAMSMPLRLAVISGKVHLKKSGTRVHENPVCIMLGSHENLSF